MSVETVNLIAMAVNERAGGMDGYSAKALEHVGAYLALPAILALIPGSEATGGPRCEPARRKPTVSALRKLHPTSSSLAAADGEVLMSKTHDQGGGVIFGRLIGISVHISIYSVSLFSMT